MSQHYLHTVNAICGCYDWASTRSGAVSAVATGPKVPYDLVMAKFRAQLGRDVCECIITDVKTIEVVISQKRAQELYKEQKSVLVDFSDNAI